MGARRLARVVSFAALLAVAARAGASTVVEPIARLSLEGGYDSNVLHDGSGGDQVGRISPDLGLRVADHLFNVDLSYGGDWVVYATKRPEGVWNQRADLRLDARPTRRIELGGFLRYQQAYDPFGLAQLGIFRITQDAVSVVNGRGTGEYRLTRHLDLTGYWNERFARFDDGTGGAMHAASVGVLWRKDRALRFGGGYSGTVFQDFRTDGTHYAFSHAPRVRAELRTSRHLFLIANAGPAVWLSEDTNGIVPEASVELLRTTRESDLRVVAFHGLGIGSTARPALVDSVEMGATRRFGVRYAIHGDVGVWHTGTAPSGDDATTGYAANAEAAMRFRNGMRFALYASHIARLDVRSPDLERATVGLRVGWELLTR